MLQVTTYPNHPGYSRLGGRTGYSLIHAVIFALVLGVILGLLTSYVGG